MKTSNNGNTSEDTRQMMCANGGWCEFGWGCCGVNHCFPFTGQCCPNEGYCNYPDACCGHDKCHPPGTVCCTDNGGYCSMEYPVCPEASYNPICCPAGII